VVCGFVFVCLIVLYFLCWLYDAVFHCVFLLCFVSLCGFVLCSCFVVLCSLSGFVVLCFIVWFVVGVSFALFLLCLFDIIC
jgi:hypothetical protein